MIMSYAIRPLAEAHGFAEAEARLHDMTEIGLPCFTLRGIDDDEATQQRLDGVLSEAGFMVDDFEVELARQPGDGAEIDHLTVEGPGGSHCSRVETLGLRRQKRGRALASFFIPTRGFFRSFTASAEAMHDLFVTGQVNDQILQPICYQGEVGKNDLLIYRLIGELPLAYHFAALELPYAAKEQTATYLRQQAAP